jgi:hypothetical protein
MGTKRKDESTEDYKERMRAYEKNPIRRKSRQAWREKNRAKTNKQARLRYRKDIEKSRKKGRAMYRKHADEIKERKRGKPRDPKFSTPEYRHNEYENRKAMGTVKTPTRQQQDKANLHKLAQKHEVLLLIALAWKRELACFCCGISPLEMARVEIEHRLPRVVLREKFPYLRLEMKSLTFDEYMSIYTETISPHQLNQFKKLTKLEIRRHFAILCRQCNLEVWNYGKCRIKDKKRPHKHWKKSSRWLDKAYGVNEYCKTSAEHFADLARAKNKEEEK